MPSGDAESDVVATEGADDAEREVDESEGTKLVEGTIPLEGTIDEEITVDAEDTNDKISTAFSAAVSASGDSGAWHSGCRGPSPSGVWMV